MTMESWLWMLVGAVFALLINHFLPSYAKQKGKNLADKEDITRLTTLVEDVKSQYALLAEQFKATQQLRMAAIDKRLQAHQEAFALWQKLRVSVHNDGVGSVSGECSTWWSNNCLYLDPAARQAFLKAYMFSTNHQPLKQQAFESKDPEIRQMVRESWEVIDSAGDIIVRSAQLPPLTQPEKEALAKQAHA